MAKHIITPAYEAWRETKKRTGVSDCDIIGHDLDCTDLEADILNDQYFCMYCGYEIIPNWTLAEKQDYE